MRLWDFDRLGGIASEQFDVNEDGLQFVSAMLRFLWMNEAQLHKRPAAAEQAPLLELSNKTCDCE
jgi:hypothetical protein